MSGVRARVSIRTDEYLLPVEKFTAFKAAGKLTLAVPIGCEEYLRERLSLLNQHLGAVNGMAFANQLPDASITYAGLKITPLDAAVPDAAQQLIDQATLMLPHVKIRNCCWRSMHGPASRVILLT